jgi:hypothetical protein
MALIAIEDLPSRIQAGTPFILVSTPTLNPSELPNLEVCDRLVAMMSFDFAQVAYEYYCLFEGDPTYRSKWERIRGTDIPYRDRYLRQYFTDYLLRRGYVRRSDRPITLFEQNPYLGVCVSSLGNWTFHQKTIRAFLRDIASGHTRLDYVTWFHVAYLKEAVYP